MADNAVKLALILSATDHMSRVIATATEKSKAKIRAFEQSIQRANTVSNKMLGAGTVAAYGIYKTITAAEEANSANKRMLNTMTQMWGAGGASTQAAESAIKMAEAMQMQIGVDDEVIKLTMSKIATFKNLSSQTSMMNGVFERTTMMAHDMAAAGFGDATGNAQLLGRALNDPINGIGRMSRYLDKATIAAIQNTYKTKGLEASQKMMLEALEKSYGGQAKKIVKSTEIIKLQFSEVAESIGNLFVPSIDKAANSGKSFLMTVKSFIDNHQKLIKLVAKLAIGLLAFGAAIRVTTFTIMAIRKVMILWNIAMGITAFFTKAMPIAMKSNVIALKAYATAMKIASIMQWLFNISLYGCPIVWIIAGIMAVIAAVVLIIKYWKPIVAFFKKIWESIKNIFAPIKTWFKGITDLFKQGGMGIVKGLAKGIWDMWTFPYRMIGKLGKLLVDKFKSIFKINSPSGLMAEYGINITTGLAKGIDSGSAKSAQSMNKLSGKVDNSFSSNQSSVGGASLVYAPVINLGNASATDKDSFAKMLQNHKREIYQLLVDMDNNKKRVSFT